MGDGISVQDPVAVKAIYSTIDRYELPNEQIPAQLAHWVTGSVSLSPNAWTPLTASRKLRALYEEQAFIDSHGGPQNAYQGIIISTVEYLENLQKSRRNFLRNSLGTGLALSQRTLLGRAMVSLASLDDYRKIDEHDVTSGYAKSLLREIDAVSPSRLKFYQETVFANVPDDQLKQHLSEYNREGAAFFESIDIYGSEVLRASPDLKSYADGNIISHINFQSMFLLPSRMEGPLTHERLMKAARNNQRVIDLKRARLAVRRYIQRNPSALEEVVRSVKIGIDIERRYESRDPYKGKIASSNVEPEVKDIASTVGENKPEVTFRSHSRHRPL